jgi:hypothetical protein
MEDAPLVNGFVRTGFDDRRNRPEIQVTRESRALLVFVKSSPDPITFAPRLLGAFRHDEAARRARFD